MQSQTVKTKTSRLAYFAPLFNVLGLFCVPFVFLGIILGIISLICNWEKTQERGERRLAWFSIATGIIIIGLWIPVYRQFHARDNSNACCANLTALQQAILRYADEHDNHLPPQENWEKMLIPYLDEPENVFSCPEASRGEISYRYLGDTVMLITDELWSTNVPLICETQIRHRYHSGEKLYVVFADGKIDFFSESTLANRFKQLHSADETISSDEP